MSIQKDNFFLQIAEQKKEIIFKKDEVNKALSIPFISKVIFLIEDYIFAYYIHK